jgi:fermentation-respiration switch protein FrsA (DUF1100 family)
MGAASVLMASELDLPENVMGIIADSSYTSPGEIIRKVSRDVHVPGWLSYPFVLLGALLYGRFCLWKRGPVDAAAWSKVPLLLIHGQQDRYVPPDMSRRIQSASGGKAELHTFPGATHAMSYVADPERYKRIVTAFLKKCINKWEQK